MRASILVMLCVGLSRPALGQQAPPTWPPPDTARATRETQLRRALAEIKGKEALPAESVYREIRMMTGVPAGRLLRIMDLGYGRSLGVTCTFCHVEDQWDREDSTRKQVARDMSAMVHAINDTLLRRIEGLRGKPEPPIVNCTTCHRGQTKPAISLEAPPQR
jgi:hypothetical protein